MEHDSKNDNNDPSAGQEQRLVVTYSNAELMAAGWYRYIHRSRRFIVVLLALGVPTLFFWLAFRPNNFGFSLWVSAYCFLVLLLLVNSVTAYVAVRKAICRPPQERCMHVWLDADDVMFAAPYGEGRWPWREAAGLVCQEKIWLLVWKGGADWALPVKELDSRTKQLILHKVQENGGAAVRYVLGLWPVRCDVNAVDD